MSESRSQPIHGCISGPARESRPIDGLNVTMVGVNYAPEETGIAPYTTAFCEHLSRLGSTVDVITAVPHYPAWKVHGAYRGSVCRHEVVNGVRLTRVRPYVPAKQTALRRAAFELSFLVGAGAMTVRQRPDVVVSVVPSLAGAIVGDRLATALGTGHGIIIQDLMGAAADQSGIPGGRGLAAATMRLERAVLRRASSIAVVSEAFRPYLLANGIEPARILSVRNWSHSPSPSLDRSFMRAALGWNSAQTVAVHAGNMGHKQGLEHLVDAAHLAAAQAGHLRFILMGDGSQRSSLEARAIALPNIQFWKPRDDFMNVLAAADVLLVQERPSVRDMSLPSKLTTYFAAGRPVVAAVRPDGATAEEVRKSGGGVVVSADDPSAIVEAIGKFGADPAYATAIGDAGRRYAEERLSAVSALNDLTDFLHTVIDYGSRPA